MESIAIISLATIVALISTAAIKKIAIKKNIGAVPDERKIHVGFIPHMGGLGIYFGGLAGLIVALLWKDYYWQMFNIKYLGIIGGATIMLAAGIIDDLRGMNSAQKFTIQFIASTIVIYSGCRIETILNPFGLPLDLGILSVPLTYLWLIGVTNAVNLMDGLDGLAAGVSLIVLATFGAIAFNQQDWMTFGICLAVIGGILGFLHYNYHPASIFMGDTGSLFLGFLIASIALKGLQKYEGNIALLVPIIALAVPIGDTALAFFRRLNQGQHPFNADKDHLHHRLLFLGLSHRQAVHIIYLFSFLFGAVAFLISSGSAFYGIILLAVVVGIVVFSLNRLGYLEAQKIKTYLGDHSIIKVKKEMAPLSMRRFWHKFVLSFSDLLALNMAVWTTWWFKFHSGIFLNQRILSAEYYFASGVSLLISGYFILLFALNGLYDMRWDVSRFDKVMRISRVIIFGSTIIFIITMEPEHLLSMSRFSLVFFTIAAIVFVNTLRLVIIFVEKKLSILEYAPHNTILVGASEKAKKILKEIRSNSHLLYNIIGVIDRNIPKKPFSNLEYLGNYEKLPQLIRENGVEEVIIAINERSRDEILNIVSYGENMRVSFKIIPQMYDVISGHKTEEVIGHPLIKLFPEQMRPWQWLMKRTLDIGIAIFLMILTSPLFLFTIVLQFLSGIFPVFIIKDRIGRQGKIFGLLLFNGANKKNFSGKLLNKTKLYGLPVLVNLLIGSITLVGPRIVSKKHVEKLRDRIKFYNRRFMIRPGITGWTQLKFLNCETLKQQKEEFKQELFYLENMSLLFDFRIILGSVIKLFIHR